jgi:glutathione S-transferase
MEGNDYEIKYFPMRGRAEVIRLLLAAAGVPFKNTDVGFGELPTYKETALLGAAQGLPCLYVTTPEGRVHEIPQSYSIIRFLAGRHGLVPAGAFDAARADVVAEAHLDWRLKGWNPVAYMPLRLANRAQVQAYFDGPAKRHLATFEALLSGDGAGGGGGDFFAGPALSYADLVVWETLDAHLALLDGGAKALAAGGFPRLAAFHARVAALPRVAAYVGGATRRPADPHFASFLAEGGVTWG